MKTKKKQNYRRTLGDVLGHCAGSIDYYFPFLQQRKKKKKRTRQHKRKRRKTFSTKEEKNREEKFPVFNFVFFFRFSFLFRQRPPSGDGDALVSVKYTPSLRYISYIKLSLFCSLSLFPL
jgi:hypothetical protein